MTICQHQRVPAMIVWLATAALHGAGAGLMAGLANFASDLLLMQLNWILAGALYLYICTQIGVSSAVALAVSISHRDEKDTC